MCKHTTTEYLPPHHLFQLSKFLNDLGKAYSHIVKFKVKLLQKHTYKKAMGVLRHAKKVKTENTDWLLVRCNPKHMEMMQLLGILPKPIDPEKRKPGRPKKSMK